MTRKQFEYAFCFKKTSVVTGFYIRKDWLILRNDTKAERKNGLFTLWNEESINDTTVNFNSMDELLAYKIFGKTVLEYIEEMNEFNIGNEF